MTTEAESEALAELMEAVEEYVSAAYLAGRGHLRRQDTVEQSSALAAAVERAARELWLRAQVEALDHKHGGNGGYRVKRCTGTWCVKLATAEQQLRELEQR